MLSVFRIGKFRYCSEEPQQINCISLSDQPEEIRCLLGLNCLQWPHLVINPDLSQGISRCLLNLLNSQFHKLSALPLLLPFASLKHSNMDRRAGGQDQLPQRE